MSLQITRWTPDTCKCAVEYSWDNDVPATSRTHSFHRTVKACPFHAALSGQAHYDAVTAENTTKNLAVKIALATRADSEPEWSYDDVRQLTLTVNATSIGKAAIRSALNAALGAGKVTVV